MALPQRGRSSVLVPRPALLAPASTDAVSASSPQSVRAVLWGYKVVWPFLNLQHAEAALRGLHPRQCKAVVGETGRCTRTVGTRLIHGWWLRSQKKERGFYGESGA